MASQLRLAQRLAEAGEPAVQRRVGSLAKERLGVLSWWHRKFPSAEGVVPPMLLEEVP